MTGLNPDQDSILSLCFFITDAQLRLLDETGFDTVIQHSKARLDQMDDWCMRTHGSSGLTAAAIASTTTAEEGARELLSYVKKHVDKPGRALLAGNSVHADRAFLVKEPYTKVTDYLHYRLFDISSIKEGIRRWASTEALGNVAVKENRHEARADILESIQEARHYKRLFEGFTMPALEAPDRASP